MRLQGSSSVAAKRELESTIKQILRTRSGVARIRLLQNARSGLSAIRDRDYGGAISAHFSRRELNAVLADFSRSVPALNRRKLRGTSPDHLRRTASRLGTDLQIGPVLGVEAQGLRGFYAGRNKLLKRPLIWVNSEQHPVALAASFWHEVGHHLSAGLLNYSAEPAIWSFEAEYTEHLDDPLEIMADMMVCLGAYPKHLARVIFANVPGGDRDREADALLSVTRARMRETTGFDFTPERPPSQNLAYLAGMLHFGKMRLALLRTYDI